MIDLLVQRRQGQLTVVRRCVNSHGPSWWLRTDRAGPAVQ
jgi:hypothetical protein